MIFCRAMTGPFMFQLRKIMQSLFIWKIATKVSKSFAKTCEKQLWWYAKWPLIFFLLTFETPASLKYWNDYCINWKANCFGFWKKNMLQLSPPHYNWFHMLHLSKWIFYQNLCKCLSYMRNIMFIIVHYILIYQSYWVELEHVKMSFPSNSI